MLADAAKLEETDEDSDAPKADALGRQWKRRRMGEVVRDTGQAANSNFNPTG